MKGIVKESLEDLAQQIDFLPSMHDGLGSAPLGSAPQFFTRLAWWCRPEVLFLRRLEIGEKVKVILSYIASLMSWGL